MKTLAKAVQSDIFGIGRAKLLSVVLAVLLSFTMMPTAAFAAITRTVDDGATGSLTVKAFGADQTTGLNGVIYSYVKVADVNTVQMSDGGYSLVYNNANSVFLTAVGSPTPDASGGGYTAGNFQSGLTASSTDFRSLGLSYTAMNATAGGGAGVPATATASNLPVGLYLVVQTGASPGVEVNTEVSPFLVSVPTGEDTSWDYSVEATLKSALSVEGITKTADKTSASIGETINYTITASAQKTGALTPYTVYTITDVLPVGITAPAASDIVLSSSTLTFTRGTDYTVTVVPVTGTITILFTLTGLAKFNNAAATETITVKYPAKLNTQATMGGIGNTNTATLAYTLLAIPQVKTASATVYSYGATLKKISNWGAKNVLSGASFKLYKTESDARNEVNELSFVNSISDTLLILGAPDTTSTTNISGLASFYGLAAGDYWLVETNAPDGYSLLSDPVKMTISAGTTGLGADITIENTPLPGQEGGFVLPITGDAGIMLLLLGGMLVMMVSGGALLYLRNRRKSEQ